MALRDDLNGFLKPQSTFFGIGPPEDGDPDVGVLGVPYDATSSYCPGSRFAPTAIRMATTHERSHSLPLRITGDCSYVSDYLSQLITLEDIGDLELESRLPEQAMYDISDAVYRLAKHSSHLLFLGGDHFVTYPIVKGLRRGLSKRVGLLWIDAHADYYENYGGNQLSHATPLWQIVNNGIVNRDDILSVDLRAALPEHRDQIRHLDNSESMLDQLQTELDLIAQRTDYLYVSVDLDVLRPESVPGVAHPESGGLDPETLFRLLRVIFRTGRVRCADVVEMNPLIDHCGITSITARDVVKEILTGFAFQKGFKQASGQLR
ncbi:MAG: arginase family protein [Candidatus Thorarchaeota archaeon]